MPYDDLNPPLNQHYQKQKKTGKKNCTAVKMEENKRKMKNREC